MLKILLFFIIFSSICSCSTSKVAETNSSKSSSEVAKTTPKETTIKPQNTIDGKVLTPNHKPSRDINEKPKTKTKKTK
jgi:hypothetical protein